MFQYEKRPVLPTRMWWCATRQQWWAKECMCNFGTVVSGCGWIDRYDINPREQAT